jgi:hypothetical protein
MNNGWRKTGRGGGSSVETWLGMRDIWIATGNGATPMANFHTPYLAALARGLCTHGIALALEAAVVSLLPFLPARVCAIMLAVVVVETAVYFLLEHRDDGEE